MGGVGGSSLIGFVGTGLPGPKRSYEEGAYCELRPKLVSLGEKRSDIRGILEREVCTWDCQTRVVA